MIQAYLSIITLFVGIFLTCLVGADRCLVIDVAPGCLVIDIAPGCLVLKIAAAAAGFALLGLFYLRILVIL